MEYIDFFFSLFFFSNFFRILLLAPKIWLMEVPMEATPGEQREKSGLMSQMEQH